MQQQLIPDQEYLQDRANAGITSFQGAVFQYLHFQGGKIGGGMWQFKMCYFFLFCYLFLISYFVTTTVGDIETHISELGNIFNKLGNLVAEQGEMVQRYSDE